MTSQTRPSPAVWTRSRWTSGSSAGTSSSPRRGCSSVSVEAPATLTWSDPTSSHGQPRKYSTSVLQYYTYRESNIEVECISVWFIAFTPTLSYLLREMSNICCLEAPPSPTVECWGESALLLSASLQPSGGDLLQQEHQPGQYCLSRVLRRQHGGGEGCDCNRLLLQLDVKIFNEIHSPRISLYYLFFFSSWFKVLFHY